MKKTEKRMTWCVMFMVWSLFAGLIIANCSTPERMCLSNTRDAAKCLIALKEGK
jgi:hypothetical protein